MLWCISCQAGVLLSHARGSHPEDWDIDNDGRAVSQLDMNDEAMLLSAGVGILQLHLRLSDNHNESETLRDPL